MLLFSALVIFTPLYRFQTMVNMLIIFFVWLATSYSIDHNWLKGHTRLFGLLFGIVLLDYIIGLVNDDVDIKLDGINKMPIYCCFFFYIFYSRHLNLVKTASYLILTMLVISALYTAAGNIAMPGASRLLASGNLEEFAQARTTIRSLNIGGYDFIYALVFLTFPFIIWSRTRKLKRIVSLVTFGVFVVTIILGAYMIGILLSVILICLTMINPSKLSVPKILFVLIIYILLKDVALEFLGEIGREYDIVSLVKHAEELETGSYSEDDKYNNRLYIYMGAIQNWIKSPFWGYLFGKPLDLVRSGHSEILGYLEKYGLFSIIYYSFFKKYYQYVEVSFNSIDFKKYFRIYFAIFIVFGVINRFDRFCGIGFMFFFFGPILLLLSEQKMEEIKN